LRVVWRRLGTGHYERGGEYESNAESAHEVIVNVRG
jgi:hypothetical protein